MEGKTEMVSSKRSFSMNPFSSFTMLLKCPVEAPTVAGRQGMWTASLWSHLLLHPSSHLEVRPPNCSSQLLCVWCGLRAPESQASAPAAFPLPPPPLPPPSSRALKGGLPPSNKSVTCPSFCTHCVPPPGLSQFIR